MARGSVYAPRPPGACPPWRPDQMSASTSTAAAFAAFRDALDDAQDRRERLVKVRIHRRMRAISRAHRHRAT
jgi:hypothetical protein